ncbi:MAG: PAS domain S-box protein [Halanaerobium sp.]
MTENSSNQKSIINNLANTFDDYKFIFDNLEDIVWVISWPELKVQFISKAVEDLIGYSVEDFKEDPLLLRKITHPEDKKINKKALKNLKEMGYAEREFRIIAKNGEIKWFHDQGKMSYDKANNPIRVEGVMRDITERKNAEEELKYHENRYQTIFNSAPIGFMLEDEEGKIIDVNEVMCEISGYTKKDLVGSSVLDKLVLPEYYELAKENIKRLIQGEDLEFDIKTPTKSGDIKYYHLKENNITLPDGSKGIISMHLDITERKRLENDLKEKNVLLNSILESIQDGIAVLNPDLSIRYINPTMKKWFQNSSALEGQKCFFGFYNKDEHCKNCPVIKSLKSGEMERGIKELPAQFEIDYIEIFSYPIYDQEKNEIKGVVEFVRDISERLEKERKIKYLAYRDSLTGLYNRKFYEAEMERLDTKRQLPISIIIGDVNGLKIINDSYGQKMGDQLLVETADLLKEVLRDEDVLARYGGDEFTILLPQTTNKTAQKVIERINNKINNKQGEIPLSISFGVATKEKPEQNIIKVLKKAEDEMNQNKLSESRSSKSNIVQGLLNTLNAKSSETKEHAVRMTKLAFEFGDKLGLSNSELNRLSLLATLHDIGKTTISEDILKKPGKLKSEEWELVKEHPKRGYKIASASEEFALVADEILAHHEKWDGSGYPDGLKAEEIPFLARIISIVDAYDVMTNDRPYSQAISKKEALEEINKCAGSQFDPSLAEAFIKLME